jgi:hypothetical protein
MGTLLPAGPYSPMDVFKGGPGRAVGQQGSREAGTCGRAMPWPYGQGAGMGQ